MSLSMRTYIGLAIVATRTNGNTTETERKCPNGHKTLRNHRFCPDCGAEIADVPIIKSKAVTIETLIEDSPNDYEDWFYSVTPWNKEDDITCTDALVPYDNDFGFTEDDEFMEEIADYGSPEMIADFEETYAIFLAEMRQHLPSVEVKLIATSWLW